MLANHIAWAAGLFEGEGTISRNNQLVLRMTDQDVVQRFADIMGVGNVVELHPPNHKAKGWAPFYSWSIQRRDEVKRILDMFLPYFGDRRAHKALDILDRLECT